MSDHQLLFRQPGGMVSLPFAGSALLHTGGCWKLEIEVLAAYYSASLLLCTVPEFQVEKCCGKTGVPRRPIFRFIPVIPLSRIVLPSVVYRCERCVTSVE